MPRYQPPLPNEIVNLKLESPVGDEPLLFEFPIWGSQGLARSIRLAIWTARTDHQVLKQIMKARDVHVRDQISSLTDIASICTRFNECVRIYRLIKEGQAAIQEKLTSPYSHIDLELFDFMLILIYSLAIDNPTKLNEHKSGDYSQTYGELQFESTNVILEQLNVKSDDVFLDMGSGVGNVVFQAALTAQCKCYGIEINSYRHKCAKSMLMHFSKWMAWLGRKHGEITLLEGNFFDPKFAEIIQSANRIFTNNVAFGVSQNLNMKQWLRSKDPGTTCISSELLIDTRARKARHDDLERAWRNLASTPDGTSTVVSASILPDKLAVSWTSKEIDFYLQKVSQRVESEDTKDEIVQKPCRKRRRE